MQVQLLAVTVLSLQSVWVHAVQAGKEAGRHVKVWAVEKNPNAIIHIQHLVASQG